MMGDEISKAVPTLTQHRSQARDRMLNGLSPEHLRLLSQLIGQLAGAEDPDLDAAARQLNNALSADEKQVIVHAWADFSARADQAMKALREHLTRSGERVVFGSDESQRRLHENPGMALLTISIEQLASQVNRERLSHTSK